MIDPRYPEKAIPRVQELYAQYNDVLRRLSACTTFALLGELEREGTAVVQELYIITPRLHEALMQASRNRRVALSRGLVERPVENYVAPNQAETVIVEPKPRKKKTSKKKKEE